MKRHPMFYFAYGHLLRLQRRLGNDQITDADPFKILWVDPTDIKYAVEGYQEVWGRVVDKDWEPEPFKSRERYQTLYQRYVCEKSWSELNVEGERARKLDNLYRDIARQGFKSQRELGSAFNLVQKRDHEIGIVIGPNGELYWTGRGRHRLCIAKILEVDQVPVQVHARHSDWQAIRDEIRAATRTEQLSERAKSHLNHPDLKDFQLN